ncbi:TetR family transcriptional regulator [Mycolicibacter engbaekii]|uniref:TetR family transcriptional regulator n=1 Tax=Mycolicibacter engbaekii TaxID=188915 RepID=A0A1X1TEB8_9MYCO|nr:TetR/AcrR family transcriptional regulator [Mycolicibacter engbaekii]ORV42884.1 TetR family transcriptional regulator [Mycolicibacter engbaekii]
MGRSYHSYVQPADNLPTACTEIKRRTQAERSAATRAALMTAARKLWGARGYAAVGTPEIAEAAGVTRGAMYHQFPDKAALFLAVVEAVEADVMARLAEAVAGSAATTPAAALRSAAESWLVVADDPEVRQLLLLDAPTVLGWDGFRDVAQRYSLGMTEQLLSAAMQAGQLPHQPVRVLAHVLIGALDEAAMVIATADDAEQVRADVGIVVHRLLDAMLTED